MYDYYIGGVSEENRGGGGGEGGILDRRHVLDIMHDRSRMKTKREKRQAAR